jgi:uncharacterized protein YdhG (YjbR/CyaY superfamily)
MYIMKTYKTVGEYTKGVPAEVRAEFVTLWRVIRELAPGGEEVLRYGVPTIRLNGRNLVHLAAAKNHLGFYPTSSGVRAFESEIAGKYQYSKGAIQFPFGKKPPLGLIRKIVKFRLAEERARKK